MRKLIKMLGKQAWVRQTLSWIMYGYIKLLILSGRWRHENEHVYTELVTAGKPVVVVFWHGRLLMMASLWGRMKVPFYMLISAHRDGDVPAWVIEKMGVKTIRGSSRRGGANALRSLIKVLKAGHVVGLTPDGPQGPRMRVKPGVISAAQMAEAYIVPLCFAARYQWHAKSWDCFTVPWPFMGGVFRYGAPIHVPRAMDAAAFEQKRLEVETAMIELSMALDQDLGCVPVPPDAVDHPEPHSP